MRSESDLEHYISEIKRGNDIGFNDTLTLIEQSERTFASEPQLIRLKKIFSERIRGVVFVGDTHGDLDPTLATFEEYDPGEYLLIFLGDYVDRGLDSIRNINYLLAQKLLHRNRVILLRGNHETPLVNFIYGFYDELTRKHRRRELLLFTRYNEVFSQMPYSVLLEDLGILALHGGLAEGLEHLDDIGALEKKDMVPTDSRAFQILWNDPVEELDGSMFVPSGRGEGCFCFGRGVAEDFISRNNLSCLIRGHQPFEEGYYFYFKTRPNSELMLENSEDVSGRFERSGVKRGFEGLILSIFTNRGRPVADPKVALLTRDGLEIISINSLCMAKGIRAEFYRGEDDHSESSHSSVRWRH